jgi:predicted site-specific integrase-resolvase
VPKELDAKQAAKKLRVHRMTISRWVTRGLLCPVNGKGKGHGKQAFTEEELMRFIQEEGEAQWWR